MPSFTVLAAIAAVSAVPCLAQAPPLSALARLPVREVTVFKDGHAYVIHEGQVTVEKAGEIRMDYLPTPVLGTFWAHAGTKPARQVIASVRRVTVERTALALPDLIAANTGARVVIRDKAGKTFRGRLLGFPTRTPAEMEATEPPGGDPKLPERAALFLLDTDQGVVTVPVDRVEGVTFQTQPRRTIAQEEFRNVLTLSVPEAREGSRETVGLMYVQKGLRWIPGYQIRLDGTGTARIRLQATLVNDMLDLKNVTVNLVIGVPSFAFESTPDPMSLQQTFARLSPYFDKAGPSGQILSQAVMTQAARMAEAPRGGGGSVEVPQVEEGAKSEDYFVFRVTNVTLAKGARMVLPVAEYEVPYKDVYTLSIPATPPIEARGGGGGMPAGELARSLAEPKVWHRLRFTNRSEYPFTTAPALIFLGDRVLAQGLMTYAAPGSATDLTLTAAVDVKVKRSDQETGRIPSALQVDGATYARTDLTGKLELTNYSASPVELEVTRYVFGHADRADANGEAANVDPYSPDAAAVMDSEGAVRPFPWPSWWPRVNGIGRFRWTLTLEPGKSVELGYIWHYFWR